MSEEAVNVGVMVLAVDQVTKLMVSSQPAHAMWPLDAQGWVILRNEANCAGGGGVPRMPVWVYLAAVAGGLMLTKSANMTASGLVIGGGLSNIASLVMLGCVPDWIQVGSPLLGLVPGQGAGIFNLADVAVASGLAMAVMKSRQPLLAVPVGVLALIAFGVVMHSVRRSVMGA